MGQLKSAIYARLEEVSFRSGVAVAGGVLAAAGVAVALTVVLGGHGDAAASAPASPAAAAASAASSPVPASSSPSSPRATPRPSDTTVPATVAGEYRSPTPAPAWARAHRAAATTPLPGSTLTRRPFSRRWLPGHRDLRGWPGWRGWHRPHASWHNGL